MKILIVPGLNGSGPEHWQTLWEKKFGYDRVRQRDWENPDIAEWVQTLDGIIAAYPERVIIVAHSLGCLAVAQWAEIHPENTGRVLSALLVAPTDVEASADIPAFMRRFASHAALPFPSILVGSENDPHMTSAAAQRLARLWKSRFVNAGTVGHINLDSGHGPWPEGEALLQDLISALSV